MNATSNPATPRNWLDEIMVPSTSGRRNGGRDVPSSSIVEGVMGMGWLQAANIGLEANRYFTTALQRTAPAGAVNTHVHRLFLAPAAGRKFSTDQSSA